jgi:hypothetical protein
VGCHVAIVGKIKTVAYLLVFSGESCYRGERPDFVLMPNIASDPLLPLPRVHPEARVAELDMISGRDELTCPKETGTTLQSFAALFNLKTAGPQPLHEFLCMLRLQSG